MTSWIIPQLQAKAIFLLSFLGRGTGCYISVAIFRWMLLMDESLCVWPLKACLGLTLNQSVSADPLSFLIPIKHCYYYYKHQYYLHKSSAGDPVAITDTNPIEWYSAPHKTKHTMTHLDIQQEATLPQCETAINSDQFRGHKPSEIKQMLPWLRGANVVIPIMI